MKKYKVGDKIALDSHYRDVEILEISKSEYPEGLTYLHGKGKRYTREVLVWLNITVHSTGKITYWGWTMGDNERTEAATYEIFQREIAKREAKGKAKADSKEREKRIIELDANIDSKRDDMKKRQKELYTEINILGYGAKNLKALLKDAKFKNAFEEYNLISSLLDFYFAAQYLPTI